MLKKWDRWIIGNKSRYSALTKYLCDKEAFISGKEEIFRIDFCNKNKSIYFIVYLEMEF